MKKIFLILFGVLLIVSCSQPAMTSKSYTVKFDTDGGSTITSQTVEEGKTIIKPADPEKIGYIFAGWYYGEKLFDFSSAITSNITISAKWNPIKYKVVYNKTSGSGQNMQDMEFVYDEEKSLTRNTYEAPVGMVFAGWDINSTASNPVYKDGQVIKNLTSENNAVVTFYAVWKDKNAHSIIYENIVFDKETINNSGNPKSYYESKNVELKNIERKGYSFDGWFTDENCSEDNKVTGWEAGDKTSDLVLYAKWTLVNYKITYEGLEDATNPNSTTYTITDRWKFKPAERKNYDFKGWMNGDKQINYIVQVGEGDVTLTAKWEIKKYRLNYILYEPNKENQNPYHIADYYFTIEDDVITKIISDSAFAGYDVLWFDNKKYTGDPIFGWSKGQMDHDITLYGKCEPRTYTITFDYGDGTNIQTQTIKYNSKVSYPDDPENNDSSVVGWYYDEEKTNPFDSSKKFKGLEDITLYPKWGTFVFVEGATVEKNLEVTEANKYYSHNQGSCFTGGGTITIPSLYVSDHEMTQAEYTKYCKYSGDKPVEDPYKPVSNVSFYEVLIYCNLRSIAEGLEPVYYYYNYYNRNPIDWPFTVGDEKSKYCWTNNQHSPDYYNEIGCDFKANGYRLPTEAEWEYIAREGYPLSNCLYSGSNELREVAWYKDNSNGYLHYGKCKKPNSLGIYDMTGNLSELCWYDKRGVNDNGYVTTRGGSYGSSADRTKFTELEVGIKDVYGGKPNTSYSSFGFRVVRTVTE